MVNPDSVQFAEVLLERVQQRDGLTVCDRDDEIVPGLDMGQHILGLVRPAEANVVRSDGRLA